MQYNKDPHVLAAIARCRALLRRPSDARSSINSGKFSGELVENHGRNFRTARVGLRDHPTLDYVEIGEQPDKPRSILLAPLKEMDQLRRKPLEKHVREISQPLIRSCDEILISHPSKGIGVIGTGGRGIYSVMRRLATLLPDRGHHSRVKLLDVSTKLLFGPEGHKWYLAGSPAWVNPYGKDENRPEKLFSYLQNTGLLDHDEIILLDTAYQGTIISALKRIIQERMPKKRVQLMLFAKSNESLYRPSGIDAVPGIDEETGRKIVDALEYGKRVTADFTATNFVGTGFEFSPWREGFRPKYEPTSGESKRLARTKHQILREETNRYVQWVRKRQKRRKAN